MHLLAALTPPNRLALEISLLTGLRISDVLGLKTESVRLSADGRITLREKKTGKTRRVKLSADIRRRCLSLSGRVFVFEHRHDWKRHRTRQAVWKDLKRAARLFRLKENIAPHSARKAYAVQSYSRGQDLKRIQRLLNHDSEAVTMLYALADEMTARKLNPRGLGAEAPKSK